MLTSSDRRAWHRGSATLRVLLKEEHRSAHGLSWMHVLQVLRFRVSSFVAECMRPMHEMKIACMQVDQSSGSDIRRIPIQLELAAAGCTGDESSLAECAGNGLGSSVRACGIADTVSVVCFSEANPGDAAHLREMKAAAAPPVFMIYIWRWPFLGGWH